VGLGPWDAAGELFEDRELSTDSGTREPGPASAEPGPEVRLEVLARGFDSQTASGDRTSVRRTLAARLTR
jgi:hypothetical protein